VDAFTFRHFQGPLVYGGACPLPEMGAVAHDLLIDSVAYRLVVPTSPSGMAARWLSAGPPQSKGVQVGVVDLEAVERALTDRGVRGVRMEERGRTTGLWLFPEVTGGPLVELVQTAPDR
jgi:hypothetical protein